MALIPNPFRLGFGLMRLPKNADGSIDIPQVCEMADRFIAAGGTYFDTAFVYDAGGSEAAFKAAVADRYPREAYTLATKLNASMMCSDAESAKQEFYTSLERTGAGYFDYYLLHALQRSTYQKYDEYGIWDFVKEQKEKGLIRHWGFSFHADPELLEKLLDEASGRGVRAAADQLRGLGEPGVASRRNWEICRAHGKPVIIMEPVKGGILADPIPEVREVFDGSGAKVSYASWALRFAAGLEGIHAVLSGMSSLAQMEDNLKTIADFVPLDGEEMELIHAAQRALDADKSIPCTACHYCTNGCPMEIPIPEIFNVQNRRKGSPEFRTIREYGIVTAGRGKAGDCIACGQCEGACPQQLPIISLLKQAGRSWRPELFRTFPRAARTPGFFPTGGGPLKGRPVRFLQLLPDRKVLRAVAFTFAASDTLSRKLRLQSQAHILGIVHPAAPLSVCIHGIVIKESARNIHALRAGHAVPASGAAHLFGGADLVPHAPDQGEILLRERAGPGILRGRQVLLNHFRGIHAGEHHGHLRLVEKPAEGPRRRGPAAAVCRDRFPGSCRQQAHQSSAPQRFHDNHRDSFGGGGLQARGSGLGVLVQIIILDLAEIPVVILQDLQEVLRIPVVGKTDIPDGSFLFLLRDPVLNAHFLQALPLRGIRQHVHQIVVDVVCLQPLQFLPEDLFRSGQVPDQILRQLGGHVHLFPDSVALQHGSQQRFAARIDICGVKVVHAALISRQNLFFCLFQIQPSRLLGKAHASVSEDGERFALPVVSVLHGWCPRSLKMCFRFPKRVPDILFCFPGNGKYSSGFRPVLPCLPPPGIVSS